MFLTKKNLLFFTFISLFTYWQCSCAQIGGRNAFNFLNLPYQARIASLGSINISTSQKDVGLFLQNPALLHKDLHQNVAFSYALFFGGVHQTSLVYSHTFDKIGTWGAGLQYLNYGTLQERDAAGNYIGTFQVSDFALNIAHQRTIDDFSLGANLKMVGSQLAGNDATAFALDLGGVFRHPVYDFTVTLNLRNIGFVVRDYLNGSQSTLPFDTRVATSFKPQNMPFRFSFTYHHLHKFDITYLDPTIITLDVNGQPVIQKKKFFDKLLRHFVFGGELLIHENFQINVGYNHLINREMRLTGAKTFAGFAYGFALKVKAWQFSYARSNHHAVSGANYFTLATELSKLIKTKKKEMETNN
ncbi:MAG: type IX secretion system protein PorQ [Microscillaceae bacterium]|nr:type IX secretion system protein PorQ [Microscillaceae bacterium]MDW8461515.1 type IX secretion system protein PorQ [Cytophagales bacterium]